MRCELHHVRHRLSDLERLSTIATCQLSHRVALPSLIKSQAVDFSLNTVAALRFQLCTQTVKRRQKSGGDVVLKIDSEIQAIGWRAKSFTTMLTITRAVFSDNP